MTIHYKDRTFYNGKDLALSVISGRWKIPIIWCLIHQTPIRLSALERTLPEANQRMLIRQLRELEEDQIITRTVHPVVPPKVEYQLSEIGKRLQPVVMSICDWGDEFKEYLKKNTEKTSVD